MTAAVLLVQALGGGWDIADLPTAQQVTKSPKQSKSRKNEGGVSK
jgi:hypothetical protein